MWLPAVLTDKGGYVWLVGPCGKSCAGVKTGGYGVEKVCSRCRRARIDPKPAGQVTGWVVDCADSVEEAVAKELMED